MRFRSEGEIGRIFELVQGEFETFLLCRVPGATESRPRRRRRGGVSGDDGSREPGGCGRAASRRKRRRVGCPKNRRLGHPCPRTTTVPPASRRPCGTTCAAARRRPATAPRRRARQRPRRPLSHGRTSGIGPKPEPKPTLSARSPMVSGHPDRRVPTRHRAWSSCRLRLHHGRRSGRRGLNPPAPARR